MRADVNMNQNVTDWRDFFNDFKKRDLIAPVFEPPPAIDIGAAKSFFTQYKHEYASFWKDGGAINVWEAAGLKRDEVRNTAVLSWLLDCHGSHGQGSLFLECFLESLKGIPENEKALALNINVNYQQTGNGSYFFDYIFSLKKTGNR